MERIEITTEHITLEGLLKFAGLAETGGEAKDWIRNGLAFVNGTVCLQRGRKLYAGDRVSVKQREFEVAHAGETA